MASRSFEQLRVYCLAEELADAVWSVVKHWDILTRDTIGKQIVRSDDGIGANIAEGYGR
jgi:four helix bundle protein